jgi:hypothetical protein
MKEEGYEMEDAFRGIMNGVRAVPGYPALMARIKHVLCATVLTVLGAAFEVVGRHVPEFGKEIESWEDGRRFTLEVLPKGPSITLEKRGGSIRYLGSGRQSPHISLVFKNYDAVLPVLFGLKGTHQAFAESRILVYGELGKTMEINRAVNIVIAYLLPGIMLKRIFKRMPRMTLGDYLNKGKVYVGLAPAIARHLI